EPIHGIIVNAYNDALIPLFLYLAPLGLISALLLLFIREDALATTIETHTTTDVARSATGAIEVITPEMAAKDAECLKKMQGESHTVIDPELADSASDATAKTEPRAEDREDTGKPSRGTKP
ncbi:MAG: MFS transporter, partial [Rothia dentocariosa]